MKLAVTILAIFLLGQIPYGLGYGPLCLMHVAAQVPVEPPPDNPERRERQVPDGEWCQRAPARSPKAHVCGCMTHDCSKRPDDINGYSAHTDPHCLNFCHTQKCTCEKVDCP